MIFNFDVGFSFNSDSTGDWPGSLADLPDSLIELAKWLPFVHLLVFWGMSHLDLPTFHLRLVFDCSSQGAGPCCRESVFAFFGWHLSRHSRCWCCWLLLVAVHLTSLLEVFPIFERSVLADSLDNLHSSFRYAPPFDLRIHLVQESGRLQLLLQEHGGISCTLGIAFR